MKERFVSVSQNIIETFIKDTTILRQVSQEAIFDEEYINNKSLIIQTLCEIDEIFFICNKKPQTREELETNITFTYIYPSTTPDISSRKDIAIFFNTVWKTDIDINMYSRGSNLYQSIYRIELPSYYSEKDYSKYSLFTWFNVWKSRQNLLWFTDYLKRVFNRRISPRIVRSLISALHSGDSFIFIYTIFNH